MKTIVILIPVFGRVEIFKLCAKSIWNMIEKSKYKFNPVIIISNNDPEHLKIKSICEAYDFMYIYWTNKPIGAKLNAVIHDIFENIEFDYLMNFGSDNLINPDLLQIYEPYINESNQFFGINNAYLYDILTRSCAKFNYLAVDHAIGAGRMIHYDIIKHLQWIKQPLYVDKYDSGLDSCSASSILFNCNTKESIIDVSDKPYIMDIKNEKNINTFETMLKIFPDRMTMVDFNDIYHHFGKAGELLKKTYYDKD